MKCTELLSVLSIVIFFRNKSASHSEAEEGKKGKKIAEFFSRKRNSALLLSKEEGEENALKIAYIGFHFLLGGRSSLGT